MTYTVKELTVLSAEAAAEPAKAILESSRRALGFVPNMYGAMANEPALLQAYISGYDAFRKECGFTPVEQEVVFLVISRENGCHYCVAAHSTVADHFTKVPPAVTEAVRSAGNIPDPKLAALAHFTSAMVASRGRPSDADVEAFKSAGYSEQNILGIILAISVKILSNYTNHVFDTPVDAAFSPRAWKAAA